MPPSLKLDAPAKPRFAVVVVSVLVLVVAAACGTDEQSSGPGSKRSTSGTQAPGAADRASLSGAGSTFVQPILQEWVKRYHAVAPGVDINYQGVGSGAGVQQLTSRTVDFAGSDVPLKPEEQAATGGAGAVVQVPWTAGGIAVEYNLPGVSGLKLSPETLAGIFAGKVTHWNDAQVTADNPGAPLPRTGIQVVHRSDGSGTTAVFTSYLTAVAPGIWTFGAGKDVPWPTGTGAKGSDQVTAAVKQAVGAMGYAEVGFPRQAGLSVAMIKNAAGSFVAPNADSVTAALAAATVNPDLSLTLSYRPPDAAAYPISTTTYLMFFRAMPDARKATALRHFAAWVLGDGQKAAEGLDYAPLPPSILTRALPTVQG